MNGIDPKFTFWFGVWTGVLLLIANLGVEHAPPIVAQYAPDVQWFCGVFYQVNNYVLTALIGVSSIKPGPLVNVPAGMVKPLVLAAVILGGVFAFTGDARAQVRSKTPGQIQQDIDNALKVNSTTQSAAPETDRQKLGCDLLNLKPGCKTAKAQDDIKNLTSSMSKPMQDFVAFVQGDVGSAITLSSQIDGLADGNGQSCFRTLQKSGNIIKQLQDTVDGGGTVGVATAFEALRLLHMNMIKTCNNAACTQIFNEATNVISAAAPMKTLIPSLTQFCAQVPSIAMEPTTTTVDPAPAPTPAAAPAK